MHARVNRCCRITLWDRRGYRADPNGSPSLAANFYAARCQYLTLAPGCSIRVAGTTSTDSLLSMETNDGSTLKLWKIMESGLACGARGVTGDARDGMGTPPGSSRPRARR